MNKITKILPYKNLLTRVISIIESARKRTVRQVDTIITQTYWGVGRVIVKEEQRGKERAEYGEYLIKRLSKDLTKKIGKGFTERNLRAFR